MTYKGVKIKPKRLQKEWSDGLLEPLFSNLEDNTDVTEFFGELSNPKEYSIESTPYTHEDYLKEWYVCEAEPGTILYFLGDC